MKMRDAAGAVKFGRAAFALYLQCLLVAACDPQTHRLGEARKIEPVAPPVDAQSEHDARAPTENQPTGASAFVAAVASTLWRSAPDVSLMSLLRDPAQLSSADIEAVINQALKDPRSGHGLASFSSTWLGLDALAQISDETLEDVRSHALEAQAFVILAYANDQTLDTLLTRLPLRAPVNPSSFNPEDMDSLRSAVVRDNRRSGLLTLPGVIYRAGSLRPPRLLDTAELLYNLPGRGAYLFERTLCEVRATPAGHESPTATASGTSTVAKYRSVYQDACLTCHEPLDGLGKLLEDYDRLGEHRTSENGVPTVPRWSVAVPPLLEAGGLGLEEFGTKVINSAVAYRCHLEQWLNYASPGPLTDDERLELAILADELLSSDAYLSAFPVKVLSSRAFLKRIAVLPQR